MMPPRSAAMWPSSEVPAPKGMTGDPVRGAVRRSRLTSSVERGKATASGGAPGW